MAYDPAKYAANKERHAEYGKRYRSKYPEKEKARHRLYKQNNKLARILVSLFSFVNTMFIYYSQKHRVNSD